MFQIQDAENDPLTRTAALCSLVSVLMSLSFGIVCIVRFDSMRSMYRASRWAEVRLTPPTHSPLNSDSPPPTGSTEDRNGHILERLGPTRSPWNLESLVCVCLHCHHNVLRLAHASGETHASLSPHAELGPRISITCQVVLGLYTSCSSSARFGITERSGVKRASCRDWRM